jgi:hypothetical protein
MKTIYRRPSEFEMESWLLANRLISIEQRIRLRMAYRDFKFSDLQDKLGIRQSRKQLFPNLNRFVEPSSWLVGTLAFYQENAVLSSEKAVSEALIFPILQEIKSRNKKKLQLFSGEILEADKQKGLNGECDFIFVRDAQTVYLKEPIIQVTEAKKNDMNDPRSLAQTAAQMVGARIFNEKTSEKPFRTIYGACTNGYEWIFLKLEEEFVYVDTDRYNLSNLPQLLGVLQTVVDFYD